MTTQQAFPACMKAERSGSQVRKARPRVYFIVLWIKPGGEQCGEGGAAGQATQTHTIDKTKGRYKQTGRNE